MKTMKITRKQLRQLISEAMYNPDTFPAEEDKHIPQSMIGGNNQEFKEKVSALSKGGDDYFRTAADLIDNSDELVAPAVVGMRGGYERLAMGMPTLRVEYLNKAGTEMIPVDVPVSRLLWRKVKNAVSEKKSGYSSLSSDELEALHNKVVSAAERWILNNVDDVHESYYEDGEFDWEDGGYYNPNNDLLDELLL